jgi:hypothetical protein
MEQLSKQSIHNIKRWNESALKGGNFKMLGILRIIDYFSFNQDIILRKLKVGDGRNGCPEEGPYDVIHVGAGAEEIPKAV